MKRHFVWPFCTGAATGIDSMKTSALLWFLYGASQSRGLEKHEQWTLELPERLSSVRAMQEDIPKVGF
jgi:hypothetical protein